MGAITSTKPDVAVSKLDGQGAGVGGAFSPEWTASLLEQKSLREPSDQPDNIQHRVRIKKKWPSGV